MYYGKGSLEVQYANSIKLRGRDTLSVRKYTKCNK